MIVQKVPDNYKLQLCPLYFETIKENVKIFFSKRFGCATYTWVRERLVPICIPQGLKSNSPV